MNTSKSILITGGTGLVGSELIKLFQKQDHQVRLLSRSKGKGETPPVFQWDYKNDYIEEGAFDGVDTIVHLAGAGVADQRWTKERKEEILDSRTQTSDLLYEKLKSTDHSVRTLVAASAVGYYGMDTGDVSLREDSPAGHDFLADVVKAWEDSTSRFTVLGIRVVQIRIGVVLSNDGGALPELLSPPIAAPLASGKQYMSWIHMDDLVRILGKSVEDENMIGPYNAVAPEPLTNKVFTKMAAKAFGKLYLPIHVPAFALSLFLGEMAQVVTGGNKVSAYKINKTGFDFKYVKLQNALEDLAKNK
ncbi:TIGR01777 family oxidoreductase [Roseivirga echinicomitans]|uniref:Epimerase n=1 Tax=Roseivirga echinicomitans TaxID=296218 RepID=A0A150XY60_9BACT|nr:TIGR01777 family oxidoreductase [Roseivirga echinicomitans]KYG83592.1 epimerase [Roseivirga echinicomitans]